jgi:hypothetical protein
VSIAVEDLEAVLSFWNKAPVKCEAILRRIGFLMWAKETWSAMRFARSVLGKPYRNEPDLIALLRKGGIRV